MPGQVVETAAPVVTPSTCTPLSETMIASSAAVWVTRPLRDGQAEVALRLRAERAVGQLPDVGALEIHLAVGIPQPD